MARVALCLLLLALLRNLNAKKKRILEKSTSNDDDILHEPTATEKDRSWWMKRRLLEETLSSTTIVNEYYKYDTVARRKYAGEVLAYVTPWNTKGYSMSLIMQSKLAWVAPVWFTASENSDGMIDISGEHDINTEWLTSIQSINSCTIDTNNNNECTSSYDTHALYVVPRVLLSKDITLNSYEKINRFATQLEALQRAYSFDGFTMEVPLEIWRVLLLLFERLTLSMKIVLVLPPLLATDDPNLATILRDLIAAVDRVSVMTYDYAGPADSSYRGAPLPWVEAVMSGYIDLDASAKKKLLLGIPMYGWRGSEAMISDTLIVWLVQDDVDIDWNGQTSEHVFTSASDGRRCPFPTPLFVKVRLELAAELGVAGVALWELGQMMPMLADLF